MHSSVVKILSLRSNMDLWFALLLRIGSLNVMLSIIWDSYNNVSILEIWTKTWSKIWWDTFYVQNGQPKTHRFRCVSKVNYAEVVSCHDGFTMEISLRKSLNAKMKDPNLILNNRSRNYPMVNLPNDIPIVLYSSQPREWMYDINFQKCLWESCESRQDSENRLRAIFFEKRIRTQSDWSSDRSTGKCFYSDAILAA